MTAADLDFLARAFGYGFGICGLVALLRPASAGTAATLWTVGGLGLGGLAAAFGTPNAGWLMIAAPAGAWMGNISGAIVRSWFVSKDN